MKRIETEIWVPDLEKKGYVKYTGQRKARDVFQEVSEALEEAGLYPDEYFSLASQFKYGDTVEFPVARELACYANWGGSEGIYLEVMVYTEIQNECKWVNFASGKTLDETHEAFIRMQYIAGYIYQLIMGDGRVHPRYILLDREKNGKLLIDRVDSEFSNYLTNILFHNDSKPMEHADEIALMSMIVKALPHSELQQEKLTELFQRNNILNSILPSCQKVFENCCREIERIVKTGSVENPK